MNRLDNARETVLKASRAYYAHLGYYEDLLAQRKRSVAETTHELDFLEFAFRAHATYRVRDVLDIACGNGRHVVGLAHVATNALDKTTPLNKFR